MPLLEIKGLHKYFGGLRAVCDVSLCIEEGEVLALIGPNGAGKTTIFNVVTGFLPADAGEVIFGGEDVLGLRPHEICAKGIARTFQIVRPFLAMSVLDNVTVAALLRNKSINQAQKKAEGVLEFLGLSEKAHLPASALTLPDRKRLEVARALATDPRILLLDEVMAGLTPLEIDHFVELLKIVNQRGITIFLIEHVMRGVMALSQRVAVLNYGRKIAEGSPEEVTTNREVIEAYLGEEFLSA